MWNLEKYLDRQALIDDLGRQMTYRMLSEETERISAAINKRSLVLILCSNSIGSISGYVSFINNNIVPMLLNAEIEKDILCSIIDKYRPEYLWVPESKQNIFDSKEIVYSSYDYVLIKNEDNEVRLFDELGLLLSTSGSTGSPKFVRQSYRNIESNARSIVEYLQLDETERPITTLPMNYTYGLSIINSHLMVGATILVTEKGLMQKDFWQFFKAERATSFGGVPYTYEMLDKLRFYRMDLPSLRYSTQAGGKLNPELHKKFAQYAIDKDKKFIVMYGQCEATARMAYLPSEKSLDKYGSMGIAIPGGRFRLVDVNGEDITEHHTTGELVYEGANVTLGYAEAAEDLIKGDERGGVLYTGDMAQYDEEGYFYIVGRKKRFLKIYGNRVNLDEIDQMIKTQFGNVDCASAGVDDHMCIFVTDASLIDKVKEYIPSRTKLNPAAFKVVHIESIPKNDSGKTLYKELEKYYMES